MTGPNIKDLLTWIKYAHRRFGQNQISRTFGRRANESMDALDISKGNARNNWATCSAMTLKCPLPLTQ